MTPAAALSHAFATIGGPAALARRMAELGEPISLNAVRMWAIVPAVHVMAVAKATGLHPYDLRPDLAPRAANRRAAA